MLQLHRFERVICQAEAELTLSVPTELSRRTRSSAEQVASGLQQHWDQETREDQRTNPAGTLGPRSNRQGTAKRRDGSHDPRRRLHGDAATT